MVRPITQADTVLAVYWECWGRAWQDPKVILAAWPDGRVVWSGDQVQGGPPYSQRNVAPKTITTLLTRFEQDGVFANRQLSRAHIGPDSPFTTLLVRSGEKQLKMHSWHELAEARRAVVTSKGVMASNYDTRVEALAHEPAEYLHFRLIWSETRRALDALIRTTGKETSAGPVMQAGQLSWQEP